jgi:hypothetical protein
MPVSRDEKLEFGRRLQAAGFYTLGDVTMSDDPTKTGNPDRRRISLGQDYEVRDWAAKFGVSEDTLRETVGRVGPQADDVARALGMDQTP